MDIENQSPTLKNVTQSLGISYIAAQHMYNMSAINETYISEDLANGLLYEWLTFINDYTDSYTNNFEQEVHNLYSRL